MDANNTPVLQYVIHELVHVTISELVIGKFDDTLEEVVVVALEGHIFNFISKSKARLAKWNVLIERKLGESDRPLKPIEEIVERK